MAVKLQVKFSGYIRTVVRFKPPKLIINLGSVQTLDHVAFRIIF